MCGDDSDGGHGVLSYGGFGSKRSVQCSHVRGFGERPVFAPNFHQPVCNSASELKFNIHVELRVRVNGAVEEFNSRRSRYEGSSKVLQLAKAEYLY